MVKYQIKTIIFRIVIILYWDFEHEWLLPSFPNTVVPTTYKVQTHSDRRLPFYTKTFLINPMTGTEILLLCRYFTSNIEMGVERGRNWLKCSNPWKKQFFFLLNRNMSLLLVLHLYSQVVCEGLSHYVILISRKIYDLSTVNEIIHRV